MKQPKSTKGIKIDVRRFKSINDSSLDYFDVKPTYIQPNERYGLDQKVIKRLYDLRKYLDVVDKYPNYEYDFEKKEFLHIITR